MRELDDSELAQVRGGAPTEWISVRLIRFGTGQEVILRVPMANLQELMNCANDHFGDRTKMIGGPKLVVVE